MAASSAFTLWLTGLPCSGKSTLSELLAVALRERALPVEVLDGDEVRRDLWPELGFSDVDRALNIRRLGHLANLLTRNGVITVVAAVSPLRSARLQAREQAKSFVEVYVDCPVAVCEERDVKGMYARARQGLIANFTGLDGAYEAPENAEVVVHTAEQSPSECVHIILAKLRSLGL